MGEIQRCSGMWGINWPVKHLFAGPLDSPLLLGVETTQVRRGTHAQRRRASLAEWYDNGPLMDPGEVQMGNAGQDKEKQNDYIESNDEGNRHQGIRRF